MWQTDVETSKQCRTLVAWHHYANALQVSPIVTVASEAHSSVPIPKAKAAETRTWAQRVAADGRKYFFDPVTRQTTWHDPVRLLDFDCSCQSQCS